MQDQEERINLVPSLKKAILEPMADPIKDLGEIMIDTVFEDGVLKDIPIIRTIAGVARIGICIRERNLAKNTFAFIYGVRSQQIPQDKMEKYRMRLENPKQAEKELGYALILLDKETQTKKAELYGKAYRAFIEEIISWDQFVELTEAISRMFMTDFRHLDRVAEGMSLQAGVREEELYGFQRLKGLGLVAEENVSATGTTLVFDRRFYLTSFGKTLWNFIESE